MPNKPWNKILDIDKTIRQNTSSGMESKDTFLQIDYIYGFELFNTRPYHNYETWSGGYVITDKHNDIKFSEEDLDDAISRWAGYVQDLKAGKEIPKWVRFKHLEKKDESQTK